MKQDIQNRKKSKKSVSEDEESRNLEQQKIQEYHEIFKSESWRPKLWKFRIDYKRGQLFKTSLLQLLCYF